MSQWGVLYGHSWTSASPGEDKHTERPHVLSVLVPSRPISPVCTSYCSCCYNHITDEKKRMRWKFMQGRLGCRTKKWWLVMLVCSQETQKLMLSNFFIFFSPKPLLLEWCQHLGWSFYPNLESPSDMHRDCLLGDSRSSQVDKLTITGDTYKYLGLPSQVRELVCVGCSFLSHVLSHCIHVL